ncbi:DNA mismatch repair endonuclease MutL [soil metagenome]
MSRIHQLPPDVVAKIAAGEVIERPASVVKELLENSLDAGSTRIDVELEQGGAELIRIVDDGRGIEPDDLTLALAAHATSKLTTADDLFAIHTLGFRGEALSSISGISKMVIQSRPPANSVGAEIHADGGVLSAIKPWGGSAGTRIEVRHLFFNVPVRKKFLKSTASELGAVCETITRLALANPHVHFTLKHNNRNVYDLPGVEDLKDRIGLFFGKDIQQALYRVESEPHDYQVKGYIADPGCDRGNAKLQYLFVNGRWFRDRSLSFALQDAYRGLLMTGRHPVGFLFLQVPMDRVDVNVHPTKAEVKFREAGTVFSLIRAAVKTRLLQENLVARASMPAQPVLPPEMEPFSLPSPTLFAPQPASRSEPIAYMPSPVERVIEVPIPTPTVPATPESVPSTRVIAAHEAPELPAMAFPELPLGSAVQMHNAYIIQETTEGMLVIDQHALHERILYEQLRRRIKDGQLEVQRLLIPEPIELPPDQAAFVLEAKDELATLGIEVSDFGGNTILLSSYPTLLNRRPPHAILASVIDELVSKERAPSKEALFNHLLATMACKAAVKAGDKLTPEEIQYLLHLRTLAEDSHHCPHGRPTTLLFSRQDLDRQFRRT